jgi:hypothetical protein
MRALTLLIQLFGREAIDALSAAGFRDNETIARAGPERLSEAAGIPVALARRIAAVAVEAHEVTAINAREGLVTAEPRLAEDKRGESGAEPPERHVRRPLRRPHSRLVDPPTAPAPRRARSAAKERGRERAARPEPPAADADPFIDEVGLVSWMGFAGKGGGSVPFSVADSILETAEETAPISPGPPPIMPGPPPVPPETATAPPPAATSAPDPRPVAPDARPATTAAATQAPEPARAPAPASQPPPAPPSAPAGSQHTPAATQAPAGPRHTPAAAPARQAPLQGSDGAGGSFWSFGTLLQPPGRPERDDPARPSKGQATPRRRTHDGH